MTPLQPALTPQALDHLQQLTRAYAKLSTAQAGLGGLLGGTFLLLVAGVEFAGHRGRLTWVGDIAPLSLSAAVVIALLPFLWLAARAWLHRWATAHFGLVTPLPEPSTSRRQRLQAGVGRGLFPLLILLGVAWVWTVRLPFPHLRTVLLIALAGGLSWGFPRLHDRLERMVGLLLFFAGALLLTGVQMAAGDTFLAYPVVGLAALGIGLRTHLAFRRTRRALKGFRL